jgi:hypothetical protein
MLPFGEWKPDLQNYLGATTQLAQNVVPRGDGYGPWKAFSPFSGVLSSATACRGFFYARKPDGSIVVFAASTNRIYKLNKHVARLGRRLGRRLRGAADRLSLAIRPVRQLRGRGPTQCRAAGL